MCIGVRQDSKIGNQRLLFHAAPHVLEYPPLRCRADDPVMGKLDVSQEVYALREGVEGYFLRMERELQPILKESSDLREPLCKLLSVVGDQNEVIGVADVEPNSEFFLDELVGLRHIEIRKHLACQVADRKAGVKAPDDLSQKPHRLGVLDSFLQQPDERPVVDRGEELSHVTFHGDDGFPVVCARATEQRMKAIHAPVSAVTHATGEGILDEGFLKARIHDRMDRMVHNSVPNGCFVNVPLFRVRDEKARVGTVAILL